MLECLPLKGAAKYFVFSDAVDSRQLIILVAVCSASRTPQEGFRYRFQMMWAEKKV